MMKLRAYEGNCVWVKLCSPSGLNLKHTSGFVPVKLNLSELLDILVCFREYKAEHLLSSIGRLHLQKSKWPLESMSACYSSTPVPYRLPYRLPNLPCCVVGTVIRPAMLTEWTAILSASRCYLSLSAVPARTVSKHGL